ncbi:MAG: hypothetical protein IT317_03395 [Anaerolineales bacterium]|nr:hypothetical protein [Anaerolineales bacterium]
MFPRLTSHIRRPVKRQGAEQYLLLSLFSFAASVTVTRLFLALTGYPQIAGGDFHIAHALWGGLLLYIASLLPLTIANRWAYAAGAALAGIGVGLFIDEVGKFITQSNDYFYPLAAPIVYAFFLLTVVLYLRVRRPPARSARTELFSALDALEEVLEQDLDPVEREALEARLRFVVEHGERPDLRQLAQDLLEFLRHEALTLTPHRPGLMERSRRRWRAAEQRWLPRRRWRLLLIGGLAALGVVTLAKSGLAVMALALANLAAAPRGLEAGTMLAYLHDVFVPSGLTLQQGLLRYTDLALEGAVSVMLLASAVLLGTGRERSGTNLGWAGLLLALTAVNLLVFYYDQFGSIVSALVQLALLFGLAAYRQRFLPEASSPPPVAAPPPPPED